VVEKGHKPEQFDFIVGLLAVTLLPLQKKSYIGNSFQEENFIDLYTSTSLEVHVF
jgi:hypothetical protein